MRQFHSLPDPEALGFKWETFEAAHERVENVRRRRSEAERTARELEERIREENAQDVRRLANAIAAGEPDPAPPGLEDLAQQLREHQRLGRALEEAEPRAEAELARVVQTHREPWGAEVDAALKKAVAEERKAYARASEIAAKARTRRQHLEALSAWVRTMPPVFSPPSDVSVQSAFGQLASDAERAERQIHERAEHERAQRERNEARARGELEAEEGAA